MALPLSQIALRLVVATVLAGIVGLDREHHRSAAGLRTHALVGMSSCLFMIASAFGFADILGTPNVTLDPSRIAAQIVTGIGFLGAGSIIAHGVSVRGLTTAASIWTVAAIGLAVGGGMYRASLIATALTIVLLLALRPLEQKLDQRWHKQSVSAVYAPGAVSPENILAALRGVNLQVTRLSVEPRTEEGKERLLITLAEGGDEAMQKAMQTIAAVAGVEGAAAE